MRTLKSLFLHLLSWSEDINNLHMRQRQRVLCVKKKIHLVTTRVNMYEPIDNP